MLKVSQRAALFATLWLAGSGLVFADGDASPPPPSSPSSSSDNHKSWNITGFGTIAQTHVNSDNATFVRYNNQANGADNSWDGRNDSLLGLQMSYTPITPLKAVVQLLSHENAHNNFQPSLDWAYLAYSATPSLTLRAGRFIVPAFMVSDFRNVDFANPWVRPPTDVYNGATINNIDGADVVYRGELGPTTYNLQGYYGKYDLAFPGGTLIRFHHMGGLNLTVEYDSLSVRVGYMNGQHSIINPNGSIDTTFRSQINQPVVPGGPNYGVAYPGYAGLADSLDRDHKPFDLAGVGAIYDNGDLLIETEFVKRRTSSSLPNSTGWYLTGGWRFGSWMPYATVSGMKDDPFNFNLAPTAAYSTLPNITPVSLFGPGPESKQKSVSVGLRYDVTKSVALKAQYDRITPEGDANGPTSGLGLVPTANATQPLSTYGSIGVTTIAVNFVF